MNFFQSPSRALKQAFGVRPRVVAPLSGPDSRDDSRPGASSLGAATAELLRPGSAAAVASLQPTGAIVGHIGGYPSEAGFVALQVAFRASGGLARGDDLVRWLQGHSNGDVASLARLIVTAELFSFEWRDTFWVPMFQFDLLDHNLAGVLRAARADCHIAAG